MGDARTSAGPAVSFAGVGKTFGTVQAVDDITLNVAAGSFVALVGASGSGKSTLLKMVNRLIEPDSGTVSIDGVDDLPPALLRRRIGYVFQNVGLFPHLTVAENIDIGFRLERRDPGTCVADMLALVDLPADIAERLPHALSGGQRQRVGVARALATAPGLMLMDEPFGALDPVTRDQLATAYRALHDRLGLTNIMVTHDMAEALLIADRVVVMAGGRIAGDATPAQILAGDAGPAAEALAAVPRAQAERLNDLARRG